MADDTKDETTIPSTMNREIITINVGGCGVALGQTLLEQYCAERGISSDGTKEEKSNTRQYDDTLSIQFNETQKGRYKARSLMIDLDPYTINNIRSVYSHNQLLNESYLINGRHDSSSNYANAHCISGKEILSTVNDQLRNICDSCDNLQGFIINHSLSGGTGAGLTSLIMSQIANDFKGKSVVTYSTMHDETFLSHPTQAYNAVLYMGHTKPENMCNYSVVLDNLALYQIVQRDLQIKTPRFKHYNYLLNKLISSITAPARYGKESLQSLQKELVPFKSLKYLTSSMWPIIAKSKGQTKDIIYKNDIQSLVNQCVQSKNFMAHCYDFDCEEDKYLGIRFHFRGANNINREKAMECMQWLKKKKKVIFAERIAVENRNISTQFHDSVPVSLAKDDLVSLDTQSVMIANNTWISRLFSERIGKIYDLLYSQRAYVHHYVGEGLDEAEFAQGRETVGFLEKDYMDSLSYPAPDAAEEEDSD